MSPALVKTIGLKKIKKWFLKRRFSNKNVRTDIVESIYKDMLEIAKAVQKLAYGIRKLHQIVPLSKCKKRTLNLSPKFISLE